MSVIQVAVISPQDVVRIGLYTSLVRVEIKDHRIAARTYDSLQHFYLETLMDWSGCVILDDDATDVTSIQRLLDDLLTRNRLARVAVLSNYLSKTYIDNLFAWGALGFIYTGDSLTDTLPPLIKGMMSGYIFMSHKASIIARGNQPTSLRPTDDDVLRMLAEGFSVSEIADKLDINQQSVYRARRRIRQHLNVRNNDQIIDAARKRGLLTDIDTALRSDQGIEE